MNYDYLVIGGYFLLMIVIGVIFKKMASNSSSDYFRGGGRMLWWMVGATAFMTQFSAWTFTGAAGKAFSDGFTILGVFIGNILAYVAAYFYFARRFRQMRVDTPTEGVRRRFGSVNEQFFTWVIIPLSVINAGVWLNGLGVFASAVFKADIVTTIWVTGIIVLLISLIGGAWGLWLLTLFRLWWLPSFRLLVRLSRWWSSVVQVKLWINSHQGSSWGLICISQCSWWPASSSSW